MIINECNTAVAIDAENNFTSYASEYKCNDLSLNIESKNIEKINFKSKIMTTDTSKETS